MARPDASTWTSLRLTTLIMEESGAGGGAGSPAPGVVVRSAEPQKGSRGDTLGGKAPRGTLMSHRIRLANCRCWCFLHIRYGYRQIARIRGNK